MMIARRSPYALTLTWLFGCLCILWPALAAAQTGDADAVDDAASASEAAAADTPTQPSRPPVPPPPPPAAASRTAPAPVPAPDDTLSLAEWDKDDWLLLKPKVSLFELNGYFRVRGHLLRRLSFGNQGVARYVQPTGNRDDFTGTNMRLRLEPIINVTDEIQIITQMDVFDNMLLGSTPDTLPLTPNSGAPVNVLSRSQIAPQSNRNSLQDALRIKRVYARVTALNEQLELRVGYMPDHWGLGILANSGDCLDCDWGNTVARLALTFKAAGHLFSPMFDWVSGGPVSTPFGPLGGQPLDAYRWDDAVEYGFRVVREEHPDEVAERLLDGDVVLQYGLWNGFRTQSRDLSNTSTSAGGFTPGKAPLPNEGGESRKAFIYTGDAYMKLFWDRMQLNAELAVIVGSFKDRAVNPNADPQQNDVLQVGGALEFLWRLPDNSTRLAFKAGAASGDRKGGFGGIFQQTTQRDVGGATGDSDTKLTNFVFSPDYHLDLLVFRQILGSVTDAWYLRPSVAYAFNKKLVGDFAVIYSQAMFKNSTPSAATTTGARTGGAVPLALEFDAELKYGVDTEMLEGLLGSVATGVAIPFGGFKNGATGEGGKVAWTIQARMYIKF